MFLTTYVNAVDPLVAVYDGFLIHSRFGPAASLDGKSIFAPPDGIRAQAVKFRTDLRVPLFTVLTETDVVGGVRPGYYLARQPDTELLRAWEIPGTAHADNYTIRVSHIDNGLRPLEDLVAAYTPTDSLMGQQPAAFHQLCPAAPLRPAGGNCRSGQLDSHRHCSGQRYFPIELGNADPPRPALDGNGLAKGGVRTPWVDVPIARTSGIGSGRPRCPTCSVPASRSMPPPSPRLYPGGAPEYLDRFATALDAAIRAGFLLPADRDEILALAAATTRTEVTPWPAPNRPDPTEPARRR